MKKAGIHPLLLIMTVFTAFLLGLFLGRVSNLQTQQLSANTDTSGSSAQQDFISNPDVYIGGRLNINTASAEDLMLLPGIGETLAQRIVEYRKVNGSFTAVEELINVKGIGAASLEEIAAYITVGGQHENTGS